MFAWNFVTWRGKSGYLRGKHSGGEDVVPRDITVHPYRIREGSLTSKMVARG